MGSRETLINCLISWYIRIGQTHFLIYKLHYFLCTFIISVLLFSLFTWWFSPAGFYICWGCLVWVPSIYTSPGMYLVNHPVNLGPQVLSENLSFDMLFAFCPLLIYKLSVKGLILSSGNLSAASTLNSPYWNFVHIYKLWLWPPTPRISTDEWEMLDLGQGSIQGYHIDLTGFNINSNFMPQLFLFWCEISDCCLIPDY